MNFQSFAEQHGLIIKSLTQDKWVRVPTRDHPNKLNGSYKLVGDAGWVINFATMEEHAMWRSDKPQTIDYDKIRRQAQEDEKKRAQARKKAASKAAWIMKNTTKQTHGYLVKKGFPNERAWVWNELLVIPMRVNHSLVGCQLISQEGDKRFLTGQQTKSATAVFDNKGVTILCEGYATALSIRRALKSIRQRYKIVVCFSANNILEIAKEECFIVADNDPKGLSVAQRTGQPYWVSDVDGEDFNDFEIRTGSIYAGESLMSVLSSGLLSKDRAA